MFIHHRLCPYVTVGHIDDCQLRSRTRKRPGDDDDSPLINGPGRPAMPVQTQLNYGSETAIGNGQNHESTHLASQSEHSTSACPGPARSPRHAHRTSSTTRPAHWQQRFHQCRTEIHARTPVCPKICQPPKRAGIDRALPFAQPCRHLSLGGRRTATGLRDWGHPDKPRGSRAFAGGFWVFRTPP